MKRLVASILVSSLLWMLFPLALFLIGGDKPTIRGSFFYPPSLFGILLGTSCVMHLLFARIVKDLRGWEFWVFPLFSMPAAGVCAWSIWVVGDLLNSGTGSGSAPLYLWWLAALFVSAFTPVLWVAYPLAIANQWIVKKLTPPAGPHPPAGAR